MIDLGIHIERVASRLFGDPNKALSTRQELRFGTYGSLAVEIAGPKRGTWYDHENKIGGGAADLLELKAEVKGVAAIIAWFRDELGIDVDDHRTNGQRIVATYDYTDEHGELLFQVVRFGPEKDFRQRQPDGNGRWLWKMAGVQTVPYHLAEVVAARNKANGQPWRVYIPEGEKDVDRLRADWGVLATCNPGGAGKWRAEYSRYFKGADAIVLADNDEAGRRHAEQVARSLAPVAHQVRLVQLSNVPEKGDVSDWIEAGGTQSDLEDLTDSVLPYQPPKGQQRFSLTRLADIELDTAPRCIVEGLIPKNGLTLVWGPPKCGKTFWTFDLAAHIALGWSYGDRQAEQGPVVYIACEGEHGVRTRAVAFRHARMLDGDNPPFYLMTTRLDLVSDLDELIDAVKKQLASEDRCAAVVIDTLNRSLHGSENKDEDMGAYVHAADRLREELETAVILIHHCGISGDRPRGHTSLTGAIDAQLAVQKDVDGTILVTLELMKDGPESVMMRCRLEPVDVGFDVYGKIITSCVVEHLAAPTDQAKKKPAKLPPAQARALTMLHEAIATGGEIPPACNHIPTNTRCAREELWRQYCYQGGISAGDQKAKRAAFQRAVEGLLDRSRIGAWDGWYWPT
jgi:hypothetical protein